MSCLKMLHSIFVVLEYNKRQYFSDEFSNSVCFTEAPFETIWLWVIHAVRNMFPGCDMNMA